MSPRAQCDNARRIGGQQRGCDQNGHQEVTEVVRTKLQFKTIVSGALRAGHDAGVIDQHVKAIVLRQVASGKTSPRCSIVTVLRWTILELNGSMVGKSELFGIDFLYPKIS